MDLVNIEINWYYNNGIFKWEFIYTFMIYTTMTPQLVKIVTIFNFPLIQQQNYLIL